jgi:hypothetical protein
MGQGNVLSQYGNKYALPLGTVHNKYEVWCLTSARGLILSH